MSKYSQFKDKCEDLEKLFYDNEITIDTYITILNIIKEATHHKNIHQLKEDNIKLKTIKKNNINE